MSAKNAINLDGQVFGQWSVLCPIGGGFWLCRCSCGKLANLKCGSLRFGGTRKCVSCRNRENPKTHNLSKTKEFRAWCEIKKRCLNPNAKSFNNYGGRGIAICSRWMESFANFLQDVGKPPSNNHSLDRINNNGNYEPGNVRWATRKEQNNNKRSNRLIKFSEKTHTLAEWSEITGIPIGTIHSRLGKLHWPVEDALSR